MNTKDAYGPIQIVCGIDAAYVPHLTVMLQSVMKTNHSSIRVHVLHDGVSDSLRYQVEQNFPTLPITWYEIVGHRALEFEPLLQITRATYLRLVMAEVLPRSINRVLYLDIDLIVNANLLPLWNTDLEGRVCAAVVDPGVSTEEFSEKYSLKENGKYFNAGVMLFDFKKLRQGAYLQKAIEILSDPKIVCDYADQDALNIVLWQLWIPLDPAWNFQRKFIYDNYSSWKELNPVARSGPLIVHFTEKFKPWKKNEWHPYSWLYLKYLIATSFKEEVCRSEDLSLITFCKAWLRFNFKKPIIFQNTWTNNIISKYLIDRRAKKKFKDATRF